MKEIKIKIILNEWYLLPSYKRDRRSIDIYFLCFKLELLKSKTKR